jgi:predicted regulator of Ras-like GTPase activity (Roadblock/LC7/MglB family)
MSQLQIEADDMIIRKAQNLLTQLQVSSSVIKSCALVSFDGLLLAAAIDKGIDSDRFAAMCASLLALAARATKEIECGLLRQAILDGDKGPMLLTRAGSLGVLAVAANPTPNLGKLIIDTRTTAKALALLDATDSAS